jgi:hypothetical protein
LTSEASGIHEADVLGILDQAPFEEMQCQDLVTAVTASFLVGKSAIVNFFEDAFEQSGYTNATQLRFLTHVALYLDSLGAGMWNRLFFQRRLSWSRFLDSLR